MLNNATGPSTKSAKIKGGNITVQRLLRKILHNIFPPRFAGTLASLARKNIVQNLAQQSLHHVVRFYAFKSVISIFTAKINSIVLYSDERQC